MRPVVISRPDRVGDVIVSSACLPLLRELHPGAPLILVARRIMQPLFASKGIVDEFIPCDGPQDHEALRDAFQRLDPEVIYHLHPDGGIQSVAEEAGIPKRVGFRSPKDDSSSGLTDEFPYLKSEGRMHEASYCRQLLIDTSGRDLPPVITCHLGVEPAAHHRLLKKAPWLQDKEVRIVINPTAARIVLRWPPEYFCQLMESLSGPGRRLVMIGHPDDDPALIYLRKQWAGRQGVWSDLGGKLDLAETATLLQQSALHISRDTGTSHMAVAVGCPALVIFARLDPEYGPVRWGPLGGVSQVITAQIKKRWWETRRQFWKRSFQSVKPADVIEAAQSFLTSFEHSL